MVAANYTVARYEERFLDYAATCELAGRVISGQQTPLVLVDLAQAADATTGALARLVMLRRDLLQSGRDLRLVGLHGRAKGYYEIYRLEEALPQA